MAYYRPHLSAAATIALVLVLIAEPAHAEPTQVCIQVRIENDKFFGRVGNAIHSNWRTSFPRPQPEAFLAAKAAKALSVLRMYRFDTAADCRAKTLRLVIGDWSEGGAANIETFEAPWPLGRPLAVHMTYADLRATDDPQWSQLPVPIVRIPSVQDDPIGPDGKREVADHIYESAWLMDPLRRMISAWTPNARKFAEKFPLRLSSTYRAAGQFETEAPAEELGLQPYVELGEGNEERAFSRSILRVAPDAGSSATYRFLSCDGNIVRGPAAKSLSEMQRDERGIACDAEVGASSSPAPTPSTSFQGAYLEWFSI